MGKQRRKDKMFRPRIEVKDGDQIFYIAPFANIPKGAKLREAYETETEIVICGYPESEDHNCDKMGCSSVNHVIYRFKKG